MPPLRPDALRSTSIRSGWSPRFGLEATAHGLMVLSIRLQRLKAELQEVAPAWRLSPVVQALQASRGVQWLVAITVVAELGDLTRFDSPRQLSAFVRLVPSAESTSRRRRLGSSTKTGNGRARRARVEGAWAYRYRRRSPHTFNDA